MSISSMNNQYYYRPDQEDSNFSNDMATMDFLKHLDAVCKQMDNSGLKFGKQSSSLSMSETLNLGSTSSNSLGLDNLSSRSYSFSSGCNVNPFSQPQTSMRNLGYGNMKTFDPNPLSKLLSNNWINHSVPPAGRAIRAASPQLQFTPEQFSSTLDPALLMGCESLRNRSSSPTESDTSGISSVSELSSIPDIMNNLNLGPPVVSGSDTDLSVASSPFFLDRRWSVNSALTSDFGDLDSIERAAKLHRNAAAYSEATCTWSGILPPKTHKNPTYSCKVFFGGMPWDVTEAGLIEALAPFGQIKVEWPGHNNRADSAPPKGEDSVVGYAHIIFENEKQVKALLQSCTHDFSNGGKLYYKISSRRMRSKEVQIIPWVLTDSNYVNHPSQRLDPSKTLFVGALHGMLTAEGLAKVMNDLFGGVIYAGIDTDKHKYPIGSGRIVFNNHKSFMKAVQAAFVEIKTPRFTKKVQCDPYLEDAICSGCQIQQGPIFCRDSACFRYFCRSCWHWQHSVNIYSKHKLLMRKKTNGRAV